MDINVELFEGNAIVFDHVLPQFKMTCSDSDDDTTVISFEPFYKNHVSG